MIKTPREVIWTIRPLLHSEFNVHFANISLVKQEYKNGNICAKVTTRRYQNKKANGYKLHSVWLKASRNSCHLVCSNSSWFTLYFGRWSKILTKVRLWLKMNKCEAIWKIYHLESYCCAAKTHNWQQAGFLAFFQKNILFLARCDKCRHKSCGAYGGVLHLMMCQMLLCMMLVQLYDCMWLYEPMFISTHYGKGKSHLQNYIWFSVDFYLHGSSSSVVGKWAQKVILPSKPCTNHGTLGILAQGIEVSTQLQTKSYTWMLPSQQNQRFVL